MDRNSGRGACFNPTTTYSRLNANNPKEATFKQKRRRDRVGYMGTRSDPVEIRIRQILSRKRLENYTHPHSLNIF